MAYSDNYKKYYQEHKEEINRKINRRELRNMKKNTRKNTEEVQKVLFIMIREGEKKKLRIKDYLRIEKII